MAGTLPPGLTNRGYDMATKPSEDKATKKPARKTASKTAAIKTDAPKSAAKPKHNRPAPSAPMYNDGMLNTAIKAARKAGNIQLRAFQERDSLEVQAKGAGDFVTAVDKECEEVIIDILSKAYPDHAFTAEESGTRGAEDAEYRWVIDPLDGTTNFIHGIPQFAVSICCLKNNKPIHAVVYDPCKNELFTATRGKGATLDSRRIRVTNLSVMKNALIGTGFPFRNGDDYTTYLNIMNDVMQSTSGLRRPGSAALDLCWVACGRYDAYWEAGLKPWDIAAGSLIALEAGAFVTDFKGDENFLENGSIVAGTPKVFTPLMAIIHKHVNK